MIHIFHEDSPDKFSEVETVKTEFGAKTLGLDSKTHHNLCRYRGFWPAFKPHQRQASSATDRGSGHVPHVGLRSVMISRVFRA